MRIDNGHRPTGSVDTPQLPSNGNRVGQAADALATLGEAKPQQTIWPGISSQFRQPVRDPQVFYPHAKQIVQSGFQLQFKEAARDPQAFHSLMSEVYGQNYNREAAESFRQRAMNNDFSWLPEMEFRSNETLNGGNGAYDAGRNIIYVNEKFKSDPTRATKVFTEEVGHFLDTKLNKTDRVGDEGEMFRRLLGGERLSAAQKAAIRADDDHGVITVDGKKTEVEFSIFDDIGGAISKGAKAVGGAISDGAKAVGGAISGGAKAVGGAIAGGAKAVGSGVASAASWLAGGIKSVGAKALDGIKIAGEAIWSGTKKVGEAIGSAAKWFGVRAWDAGKGLFTGAIDTLTGAARNVVEGIGTFGGGIGKIFKGDFVDGLKDMGLGLVKTFVQTPVDGVLMMGGRAISAVQTMVGLEPPGRKLTSAEITELRKVYGDSIDYSKVEIKEGDAALFGVFGRPFTHGNTIYMPKDFLPLSQNMDTLVHEMGHVWQNQHGGTDYMSEALWAQNFGDKYEFDKGIDEGKSWSELNPEQQAELIQQAYQYGYFDPSSANSGKFVYNGKDYSAYVAEALKQLRAGKGAP